MATFEAAINRVCNRLIIAIAVVFSVFHLYLGITGTMETYFQRSTHVFLGFFLLFLMAIVSQQKKIYKMIYVFLFLCSVVLAVLTYIDYDHIVKDRIPFASPLEPLDIVISVLGIALLLEATRRAAGFFFAALTAVFILYVFIGPFLPGILYHGGTSLDLFLDGAYLTTDGIFGIPIGASATYVALFVIFGAFLEQSGIGELIMDVSNGIFGRFKGGPAKGAVVASGAFGSIDGNATADVMVTGSVNIPLMMKIGYKPHFAAGIEAAAASGGVLLPPVMGTVAFLMSDYTGIPYSQIMIYAIIPALLFYVGVFSMVHFQALRLGMRALTKEEIPDWKRSLKEKWHLLIPVIILVALIINHFSPMYAVSYSILSIILVANLRKNTRMGIRKIYHALINGAKGSIMITMATAAAGLMIYIFTVTGIGLRFTENLIGIAGGVLFFALLLTMVTTILLGMGVPPSASYLIQVAVTIPPVVALLKESGYQGDALAAAHMFVMYYASMAVITPPVALAAFAAAGIAKTNPLKTGFVATQLAFTAFVVPFLFAYYPEYLMMGTWYDILLTVATGFMAIVGFSAVFMGFFIQKLSWTERAVLFIASATLMTTNLAINIAGLVLYLIVLVMQYIRHRNSVFKPASGVDLKPKV